MSSPSELAKRERQLQREVSREFGRADQRRAGGMHRTNVYLEENAKRLAQKGELSLTLRALLRAGQGTTLGKLLEDQVKLERTKRDLSRAQVRLAENKAELDATVNWIHTPTEKERAEVQEDVPEVQKEILPDVLELIGDDGMRALLGYSIVRTVLERAAADPAVVVMPDEDGTNWLIRDETASEKLHDISRKMVKLGINDLEYHAGLVFLGAQEIIALQVRVEELERRLQKHGERWEKGALAALGAIAEAYEKFSYGRTVLEDEALVWFEGHVTNAAAATQVNLEADELMRVILQYIEGGPPAALGVLQTYF